MNKTVLTLTIAALAGFSACTSKNSGSSATDTDSIPTDTAAVVETQVAPAPTFISDDLKELGLKGNVKSVKHKWMNNYYGYLSGCIITDDLMFDENGKRIPNKEYDSYDCYHLTKNPDGFVISIIYDFGASDGTALTSTYTLDEEGRPVSAKSEMEGPEEEFTENLTFSYPETDARGNWTKCIVKDGNTEHTLTRTITYYE